MTARGRALMILHEARESSADRVEYHSESADVARAVADRLPGHRWYVEPVDGHGAVWRTLSGHLSGTTLRVSTIEPGRAMLRI